MNPHCAPRARTDGRLAATGASATSRMRGWALFLLLAAVPLAAQQPLTAAFTYQGELRVQGTPANASYDMEFRLYPVANGGSPIGGPVSVAGIAVANGLFSVPLDFGPAQFAGDRQWLEVRVRAAGSGSFETLAPRTEITAAPYAWGAAAALAGSVTGISIVDGSVAAADIDASQVQRRVTGTCTGSQAMQAIASGGTVTCVATGTGTVTQVAAGAGLAGGPITSSGTLAIADGGVTSSMLADGSVVAADIDATQVQLRVGASCAEGSSIRSIAVDGSVACEADDSGGVATPAWQLGGNAGTDPSTHFVGTTDAAALELRTAGARNLRLESSTLSFGGAPLTASIVAGSAANLADPGIRGATIAGGGVPAGDSDPDFAGEGPNRVSGHYGAIGGGFGHEAAAFAVVGGGRANRALGGHATVSGGNDNRAENNASTVGGGESNLAGASSSTVAGGGFNVASGLGSTIGGGAGNQASAIANTVAGGLENQVSGPYGSVGGGYLNSASGEAATVAGGRQNLASSTHATLVGGRQNVVAGNYAALLGGHMNSAAGEYATVGGGFNNHADIESGSVGGGQGNRAGQRAFVGGGLTNEALGLYAVIAGGNGNDATGVSATVAGGAVNIAAGDYAQVGGGSDNDARGDYSAISGGVQNVTAGFAATVTGGQQVSAVGRHATAGGYQTCAGGARSWAGGYRAVVRPGSEFPGAGDGCFGASGSGDADGDEGSFVWADGQAPKFETSGANQFAVRAIGGFYFGSNSTISIPAGRLINTSTGAHLTTGGTWTNSSSRALKTAFEAVDVDRVLAGVLSLPITRWRYTASASEGAHLGPVAEDFRATFGLGTDASSISTVDADGVALAAIQGLAARQDARHADQAAAIATLAAQNQDLLATIAALEARLRELESERGAGR